MKFLSLTLLATLCWAALTGQSFESPIQYFDFFNQSHQVIAQRNMEYIQHSVHSNDLVTVVQKRLALIQEIDNVANQVRQLPAYEQDAGMRSEMLAVLGTYQQLFKLEFDQVENLKAESEESYAAMERYLAAQDAAEAQLAAAANRFLQAQRSFASANHIQLIEGSPDPEMTQLSHLNSYQRAIFLEGFRLSKRNAAFLESIDGKDAERMESLRLTLLEEARQSAATLRSISDYQGNVAYRDAVLRQAEFFELMAERYYPAMINVSSKDSKSLTHEDVDAYNEAAEKLNVNLSALVSEINISMQDLMRQHVPKPNIRDTKQI